ncbi:MAG: hypoxanthine-guanine phosphoribosyltransferase [Gammaproteobacteria bacterium SG8_47]|nr:MAG: hypoxanthine-guanine phosphoribosyltransferase [Gammaproteobacteria bacterium SG8_47]
MSISALQAKAVLARAECVCPQAEVEAALVRMAAEITERLADKDPLVLCVMNGALIPAGQLLTRVRLPLQTDYIHATRYRGETSGGRLHWLAEPSFPLAGRVVLIVDDILDEGHTLTALREYCLSKGAREVYSAVFVRKCHDRCVDVKADFVGVEVEDRYVFGFGMDYKDYWRNLPAIYAASPQDE